MNRGTCLETARGDRWFLKWHHAPPAGMYRAEAAGLDALRLAAADSAVRVPSVLAVAEDDGWLLLEYVEPGPSSEDARRALGRGLAVIHAAAGAGSFGWDEDNWIGALPQANPGTEHWADFWIDARLTPQLERARASGHLVSRRARTVFDRLLELVPGALTGPARPDLLHGDLWSGNTYTDASGRPILIDPAVYRGHGEVDLAMTELFGGSTPAFRHAYHEVHPADAGYADHRRALYQLYYLLVHVNLFGQSYVPRTLDTAERVVAALG